MAINQRQVIRIGYNGQWRRIRTTNKQGVKQQQQSVRQQSIKTVVINGQEWYQISQKHLPLLFRFTYNALLRVKMPKNSQNSSYAKWLFEQLMNKILTTRYSSNKTRKYLSNNTRMKSEEKVKFLIRAFEIKYAKIFKGQRYDRVLTFNHKSQGEFFAKGEVRKHFLNFLPQIIKEKHALNKERIRQFEKLLSDNLILGEQQPQKGQNHFERMINKLQLPWTDNMFTDIQAFGKKLYHSFCSPNSEQFEVHDLNGIVFQDDLFGITDN